MISSGVYRTIVLGIPTRIPQRFIQAVLLGILKEFTPDSHLIFFYRDYSRNLIYITLYSVVSRSVMRHSFFYYC